MIGARTGLTCLTLALFLSACTTSASHLPSAPKEDSPAVLAEMEDKLQKIGEIPSPIGRLEAFEALAAQYAGHREAKREIAQFLSWAQAEVGDDAGALRSFPHPLPMPLELPANEADFAYPEGPPLDGYAPLDALETLAEAADSVQVIMINEAHHIPQHRAFTIELLGALRKKGFTYFAAEALGNDPGLAERGYPTEKTGTYFAEPLCGDMVRTALHLGYKIVPYEPEPGSGDREGEQAANIARILQADPRAKILVHAGYSHIEELPLLGKRWMASRFKEMAGIDPLTVNQDWMTEQIEPKNEAAAYRRAVEAGLLTRPVVFRNGAGKLWTVRDGVDVTLFHPRSHYENGRPTWLRMNGLRSPFPLPQEICGPAPRCLVRARSAAEGPDATPIDQILAEPGRPVALLLPAGEFALRVEDAAGKVLGERSLRMP
jgi:hypothetical protein